MARCGCGNGTCSCKIIPGTNVTISGTGSPGNPYIITAAGVDYDLVPGILTVNGLPGPTPILTAGDVGALAKASNLGDLTNPLTARANLAVWSKTESDARFTSSPVGDAASIIVDRPSGVIEGMHYMWIYGNSYVTENGGAGSNYTDRLRLRVQPQRWFNGGTVATQSADGCAAAFGNGNVYCPGSAQGTAFSSNQPATFPNIGYGSFYSGMVIYDYIRNDAGSDGQTASGGTTAKSRAGYLNHMDALVRLARAEFRIPNKTNVTATTVNGSPTVTTGLFGVSPGLRGMPISGPGIPANTYVGTPINWSDIRLSSSATSQVDVNANASGTGVTLVIAPKQTGTWAVSLNPNTTNGVATSSSTNASTLTYNFYLPTARRVAWTTLAFDSNFFTGSTYSLSVDGGAAITGTTNNQTRRSLTGFNNGYGQMCVPLDAGTLAAGFHSVVITHTGAAGTLLYDDSLLIESATPPTVVLPKSFPMGTTGYNAYILGGGAGAGTAKDLIYDGILDTIVARFPADGSVFAPDPKGLSMNGVAWNAATMLTTRDGVHKNDIGEQWTTDWLMGIFNKLPARAGLIRL